MYLRNMLTAMSIEIAPALESEEWNPSSLRPGVDGLRRWQRYVVVTDPPRPSKCDPWKLDFDADAFQRWWDNIDRIGCEFRIDTPRGQIGSLRRQRVDSPHERPVCNGS